MSPAAGLVPPLLHTCTRVSQLPPAAAASQTRCRAVTQKLEYKYSKLVMTTNSKECELPAADSCAIMEGEDNEEEVVYSNKQSLLGKLKSLATKEKEDHFESVQLKTSRSPNI